MVDARTYHYRTKHSPRRLREDTFTLEYENQPRPYKVYEDLPRLELTSITPPQAPTLSVIAESTADPLAVPEQPPSTPPDRETLATLCYEATGVVSTVEGTDRTVAFRAASCTGKLYHIDCYLVCGDLPDLDAGIYHFDPATFAFDVIREGDYRGVLEAASGEYRGISDAPVTVVMTSTWWRNAWKYRDRTYRHAFWDSGTILANLLATAHALDHRVEVVTSFVDDRVAHLLGIDPVEEAPLQLVPIGRDCPVPSPPSVPELDPHTEPLSETETEYPLVYDAWEQSTFEDANRSSTWRERAQKGHVGTREAGGGECIPLDPVDHETATARPLHETIQRRGSCREYTTDPIGRRALGTILDRATRGIPGDWNGGTADGLAFNDVYILAARVAGVPSGSYHYHAAEAELERIGDVTEQTMSHLALDQQWAGAAHVNVYLLSDIEAVVEELGNRGYRLAQLEAGIVLGKLYLATYAHRTLGGTGLTFYDDRVTDQFEPRASGQTPTTLFALGRRNDG